MDLVAGLKKEQMIADLRGGISVLMHAYGGSGSSSGMDWFVVVEHLEDDTRVVGVENTRGDMVMGDCMSDVNNEVTEADAKHIALMDPRFTQMTIDMFRLAIGELELLGPCSPVVDHAVDMARHLKKRWDGGMENGAAQAAGHR